MYNEVIILSLSVSLSHFLISVCFSGFSLLAFCPYSLSAHVLFIMSLKSPVLLHPSFQLAFLKTISFLATLFLLPPLPFLPHSIRSSPSFSPPPPSFSILPFLPSLLLHSSLLHISLSLYIFLSVCHSLSPSLPPSQLPLSLLLLLRKLLFPLHPCH